VVHLRIEQPEDAAAISAVIELAFADHPHSDRTEARIVERLRAAGALTVSLVAIESGAIVGHVACSPVSIEGVNKAWCVITALSIRSSYDVFSPTSRRRRFAITIMTVAAATKTK